MPADRRDWAIGVFDSGVGGLTVLQEITALLPGENLIYLGDTARVPYGSKPRETVVRYALEEARFLANQKVKALVVACNTICCQAMGELVAGHRVPVIGVIGPASAAAARMTRKKAVGVIATEGTINSGVYQQAIKELDSAIEVYAKACPLFVPLVEEGVLEGQIPELVAEMYLKELAQKPLDVLILGCTHYPLLAKAIAKAVGPGVALLNPAKAVAEELKLKLAEQGLLRTGKDGYCRFFFTSQPQKAEKIIRYLGLRVDSLGVADLAGASV